MGSALLKLPANNMYSSQSSGTGSFVTHMLHVGVSKTSFCTGSYKVSRIYVVLMVSSQVASLAKTSQAKPKLFAFSRAFVTGDQKILNVMSIENSYLRSRGKDC